MKLKTDSVCAKFAQVQIEGNILKLKKIENAICKKCTLQMLKRQLLQNMQQFKPSMLKHINLQNQKVPYTLKMSARAKRLRLAIYCDGAFVVTAPRGIGEGMIEKFILQKSQWIMEKIEYFKSISGVVFVRKGSKREYTECKERALTLAEERLEYFNTFYNFKYNKVNIKNQKTRWGSCSGKGNLNFNYKIALLPPHLADYIIVHELCHLKEFNHSRKFWALVAETIPDYIELRKELKKSGCMF